MSDAGIHFNPFPRRRGHFDLYGRPPRDERRGPSSPDYEGTVTADDEAQALSTYTARSRRATVAIPFLWEDVDDSPACGRATAIAA